MCITSQALPRSVCSMLIEVLSLKAANELQFRSILEVMTM